MQYLQTGRRVRLHMLWRFVCLALCLSFVCCWTPVSVYAQQATVQGDGTATPTAAPQEAEGFAIWVDQWEVARCATQEDAQWVLDSLLDAYRIDGAQVSFKQQVDIQPGYGALLSREEALYVMQHGGMCFDLLKTLWQTHPLSVMVQTMESLCGQDEAAQDEATQAEATQAEAAQAEAETAQQTEETLQGRPLVNVIAVQTVTEEASIPYTTQKLDDSTLEKGKTAVTQKGVKGSKSRTVTITYEDGVEVGRTEGKWETVTQPVKQVVRVGTKATPTSTPPAQTKPTEPAPTPTAPPAQASTPSFGWPVASRTLTSWFGEGRGSSRKHAGIDIDANKGAAVVASASGKVTRVRNDADGYGLYVDIDHGNGWTTRYAHNSKILVRAGQTVAKGEKIALVGSTGASSGPHLHFEILKNGSAKNPLSYLP